MPDDVSLDTAIPPIGWQEAEREAEPEVARKPSSKKRKRNPSAERPTAPKPPPAAGTGTKIDIMV